MKIGYPARADLAHVTACIAIFKTSGDEDVSSHVDAHRRSLPAAKICLFKEDLDDDQGPHVTAAGLDTGYKCWRMRWRSE